MAGTATEREAFEHFLSSLDATSREAAGLRYEELRTSLIRFFRWRGCSAPDELADETLRRAINRSADAEPIVDAARFVHGIARLVALEGFRSEARKEQAVREANVIHMTQPETDARLECLDQCLAALSESDRELIISYYAGSRGEKIDHRRSLADTLAVSLQNLRVRAHRLRERLERCLNHCLENV